MLNQLFYRDYARYQQDKQYAEMVYKDIKKIVGNKKNDIKVVFKGFPDYYKCQQIEMIGDSYFFHDREYSEYFEKTSPRIVDFMKMLGMKVKSPSFEEVEKIWGDSLNMEPWPMESSIRKIDDIVLVKLGESPYSSYKMSRDDFIKKFKYKIKKEGIIKEEKKKIYNQASVYYCADLKIKMNEDIQVFLVRSYKNTQHVYDVSDLIYPAEKFPNLNIQLNFAEDINEGNNSYELYLVYYINGTGYIEKI